MKILEVRDGFLKFETDGSAQLSSFIQLDSTEKSYVAQIYQIKRAGENAIAYAKILFLYTEGSLLPYDKTLPSKDATINEFTFDILSNSIKAQTPIIIGKTAGKNINITIDASAFDKKMLMSIDDKDSNNTIVRNLVKQFNNINKKVIIIDSLGVINAKKITAGVDFKLPLDTASLSFMYKDCLNDATQDSKDLIIEIFKDLAEYSKTVPFVPFEVLKNIIDDMVDNQHVFKLLVLKNKLSKFNKLGYFAKNKQEVEKISNILNANSSVIDISKLDIAFQNRYLAFLYEKLEAEHKETQVILELSNTVSKSNLKHILDSEKIATSFITHTRFKYLKDMKNLFDNFIISPSFDNNRIFNLYTTFLNSMKKDSYLITGEAVNYIPLVSTLGDINDVIEYNKENTQTEIAEENVINGEKQTSLDKDNIEQSEQSDTQIDNLSSTSEVTETVTSDEGNTTEETDIAQEITTDIETNDDLEENVETVEVVEDSKNNRISNEEILNTIEERSEEIIKQSAQETTPMPKSMFGDDDEDDENEVYINNDLTDNNIEININEDDINDNDDSVIEDNIQIEDEENVTTLNAEDELVFDASEVIEELPNNDIDNTQSLSSKDLENELNLDSENIYREEPLNEQDLDNNIDNLDNEMQEDSTLSNIDYENELIDDSGISLENEDNISTNIIEDYEPIQETEIIENSDLKIDDLEDDNVSEMVQEDSSESLEAQENIDNEEVELPENIDLDIDNESEDEINTLSSEDVTLEDNINSQVLPINENNLDDFDELEEIEELDLSTTDENDIIIDIDDSEEITDENSERDIVNDVDKVFTTRKDEDISDSDLDLIDQINSNDELEESLKENVSEELDNNTDFEELSNYSEEDNEENSIISIPEEQINNDFEKEDNEILKTKNTSTPIVPVYDADVPEEDIVISDPIQQGDSVSHAKYGSGVVEKMIKYGNKTLYSINFDNIGRRLLDPTLTEIKKA